MSVKQFHVLPNMRRMPLVGYGTCLRGANTEEFPNALDYALQVGYRHIDTAIAYLNEADIGVVLRKWFDAGKLKRQDVFITTKSIDIVPDKLEGFLKESLRRLQLDYVDLFLLHLPCSLKRKPKTDDQILGDLVFEENGDVAFDLTHSIEDSWRAMEKLVDAGLTKEIGVSNFNVKQFERIAKVARIRPATNQVELHAYFQQKELRAMCSKYGATVTSYGSLGSYGRADTHMTSSHKQENLLENAVVKRIAAKHSKSVPQVLLRHLMQLDIIVIPKSVTPKRILENFQLFDFQLDESDMKALDDLDKGYSGRSFHQMYWQGVHRHPEFPHTDAIPK